MDLGGCANAVVMKTRLTADATQNELDFNDIMSMYRAYVDLLRRTFYKEEYL
jgi:hypothetical protein